MLYINILITNFYKLYPKVLKQLDFFTWQFGDGLEMKALC